MSELKAIIWLIVTLSAITLPAILYVRLEDREVGTPARLGFAALTCGAVIVLGTLVTSLIGTPASPAKHAAPGSQAPTQSLYAKTKTPHPRAESVLKTGNTFDRQYGGSRLSSESSPADGTPVFLLSVNAITGQTRTGATPSFHARCQSRKTEAYIVWGTGVGDDGAGQNWKYVTVRAGLQKPERQRWTLSTDKQATFAPPRVNTLFRKLEGQDKFTVLMTPHMEAPIEAVFPLEGFHEALKELRQVCSS